MKDLEAENLSRLVEVVLDSTKIASDHEWWFRGHGRSSWSLVPSLYRKIPDVSSALETEGQVLLEFDVRSRRVAERAGVSPGWDLLFLMQHYRVPTRLLDWSRNLLIAAFFAVENESAWMDSADPPCVFAFSPKYWNSNVFGTAGMTVVGPSGVMRRLTELTMAGYEPRVSGGPAGPSQRYAAAIAGPEFAARIAAQRGVFTVFGTVGPDAAQSLEAQERVLDPNPDTLSKIKLTGDKDEWRRSLKMVGIGEFTAFPDLDGLARELQSQYF